MATKPSLLIKSRLSGAEDGVEKRYVVIVQSAWCRICTHCQRAIWPTHYFPRGVRVEEVERDNNVTHGHDDADLCDKCHAQLELENEKRKRAYYAEQGIDIDVLNELLTPDSWEASKDPSISHDIDWLAVDKEEPKETYGDDPANY